jgi:hypothetical protein
VRKCEIRERVEDELKRLGALSWEWATTRRGHLRLRFTSGEGASNLVHIAAEGHDVRTIDNSVALVRRKLRKGEH